MFNVSILDKYLNKFMAFNVNGVESIVKPEKFYLENDILYCEGIKITGNSDLNSIFTDKQQKIKLFDLTMAHTVENVIDFFNDGTDYCKPNRIMNYDEVIAYVLSNFCNSIVNVAEVNDENAMALVNNCTKLYIENIPL